MRYAPAMLEGASSGFWVELPVFRGTLAELAAALRSGRVLPAEVPLLTLTRQVLAWWKTQTDPPAEALPALAAVIALKAKLLLPREQLDDDPEPYTELEEVVEGVETLAALDELVQFLASRRQARTGLMPGRGVPLQLPRRQRAQPTGSLAKLVAAAKQAVREVEVPLLAKERLTLAAALAALLTFGERLKTFQFRALPAQDWGEETTYFAALLEGVKEGQLEAQQQEQFGDITVVSK